ncbi:MAG TPA: GlsB/YeaQ/YmgE family stress response membrane protein [Herpetosiphonaceae bacterium]|jgi:uncharacterized membrane protein YeaQ/YmgE (transglycosylase-associated protein family)|nr:GlsB/YeaQ/YmgE family stress response membrane protein [Herpetosiphonaceae bacterium]
MGIIAWLIFGAIVGWLASMIMNQPEGLLMDIIVGIVGAFIGGWLSGVLGIGHGVTSFFDLGSWLVALLGAIVLLAIVNFLRRGVVR